jgi:hypothetical protein
MRAMMTVKDFIGELGGTKAVAEKLNLPISTVSGWNINNSVPKWRLPALKALAARKKVEMPETFAEKVA